MKLDTNYSLLNGKIFLNYGKEFAGQIGQKIS